MQNTVDRVDQAFRASALFQDLEAIDDVARFDSSAKRQHFVSRFLLARFSDDSRPGQFFQLDTNTGQPRRVAIDGAASRRYFYAIVGDDGTRHSRVEGFLAIVESHAAPALDRLLRNTSSLSDADRATLSFFFALLDQRTPAGTERLTDASDTILRMLFTAEAAESEPFARHYREVIGEARDEEIEELRHYMLEGLAAGRVGLRDPRANAFQLALGNAGSLAQEIFQLSWTLLTADSAFVSSDRGLAMHDPSPRFPWGGVGWRSSPSAETMIPLSSDVCLVTKQGNCESGSSEASAELVDTINLRMYGWADQFIFGHSQALVTDVRRLAKLRPRRVPHPQPPAQVVILEAAPSDTSLADVHRAKGWPPYLIADGTLHDYVVIGREGDPVSVTKEIVRKAKERSLQRAPASAT